MGYEKRLDAAEWLTPSEELGVGEDGGKGENVPGRVCVKRGEAKSRLYISSYSCCNGSVLPEVADGEVDGKGCCGTPQLPLPMI